MANYYLLRLSVFPYVKKYLSYHYSEPLFVTKRGHIPSFLSKVLEPMPKRTPQEIKRTVKIEYGEYFGFAINQNTIKNLGCSISSDNVRRINEVISDIIHEEMYRMITQRAGKFVQVDATIREFQASYNFSEDELPFENLKKWYYRERKSREDRRIQYSISEPEFILTLREEKQAADCVIRKIAS